MPFHSIACILMLASHTVSAFKDLSRSLDGVEPICESETQYPYAASPAAPLHTSSTPLRPVTANTSTSSAQPIGNLTPYPGYNGSFSTTPTVSDNLHPTGLYPAPESSESRIHPYETSSNLSLPPSAGLSHPSYFPSPSGFNHTGSAPSGPKTGKSSDPYTRASFTILPWTGHPRGTGFLSSSPSSSNGSHSGGSGDRTGTYHFSTGVMTSGYPSVSLSQHRNSSSTITIKTTIINSTHTVFLTTTITPFSSPKSPVTASNSTFISPTGYISSTGHIPSGGIASSSSSRNSTSPYVPVISSNNIAPYPSTTRMTVYLSSSSGINLKTSILLTTEPSTSSALWSPVTAPSSPSPYLNLTTGTVKPATLTPNIPAIPTTGYPGSNTNGERSGTFPAYSVSSRSIPSDGFSSYITKSSSFPVSPITASNSSSSALPPTTMTSYTFPLPLNSSSTPGISETPDNTPISPLIPPTTPSFSFSYTAGNRTGTYRVPTFTAYSSSSSSTPISPVANSTYSESSHPSSSISITITPATSPVSPVTASTSQSSVVPILTSVPVYSPPTSFATSVVASSSSVQVSPASISNLPGYGGQGYGGWGSGWWKLFR